MTSAWLSWPLPPLAATPREPVVAKAATQRISFSGPQQRTLWQPRLERLGEVALTIEFEMVRQGRLPATVVWTGYDDIEALTERVRAIGLETKPIKAWLGYAADWPLEASIEEPKRLLDYAFLIGAAPLVASIAEPAEDGLEQAAIRFGYPACCAKSWADHLRRGGSDPLAGMLAREDKTVVHAHVAIAVLGLGPVRHAPCSADCFATHDRARAFLDLGRQLGFAEEMSWLDEIADWAVGASLVNGIAEITTAAFRCTWLSDEVLSSHRQPHHAATTKRPEKRKVAAVERADGAAILAELGTGFEAAGFENPLAMRSRFSTIVWEQTAALRRAGSAVHVGCGDGLLLELIAQTRPKLTLYGIEEDAAAAQAARQRIGASSPVLGGSSIEALAALSRLAPEGIDLAFVDPERLGAREALAAVRALAKSVIVIGTDRSLRRFTDMDTLAATMGLALLPGRTARVSAILSPTMDRVH
jgi:predicted O-methyltransferase YrrM